MISTQVSPELSPFAVEANAQKLVTLLAVLGFSIDSVAERRGNKLLVTFIGAANCWGLRSLSQGNPLARPPLVNDFGAKVRRMCENQNLTACSPRNDFVKNYRVHPTHWLTSAQATGMPQADGSVRPEPRMTQDDAARAVHYMCSLPLSANVLQMTVMASGMPFVGRG